VSSDLAPILKKAELYEKYQREIIAKKLGCMYTKPKISPEGK
jgi:hypothetical protein